MRWNYSQGRRRVSGPKIQSKHSSLTLTVGSPQTLKKKIIIVIENRHAQLIATRETP